MSEQVLQNHENRGPPQKCRVSPIAGQVARELYNDMFAQVWSKELKGKDVSVGYMF